MAAYETRSVRHTYILENWIQENVQSSSAFFLPVATHGIAAKYFFSIYLPTYRSKMFDFTAI